MRHKRAGVRLNRDSEHRKAMRRNLAIALITHEQITTTVPKAKFVRPFVEKLVTAARKGDLASRRRVISELGADPFLVEQEDGKDLVRSKSRANRPGGYQGKLIGGPRVVKKLFDELGPRFKERDGGYTRIVRLGMHRLGDGTDLCVIQFVSDDDSGSQVGGKGLRKGKAVKRMEFAARLRKSGKAEESAVEETGEAETATAVAEPPVEEETTVDDQASTEEEAKD